MTEHNTDNPRIDRLRTILGLEIQAYLSEDGTSFQIVIKFWMHKQ